jgi:quercetin dioxygenase-like cupin family protein
VSGGGPVWGLASEDLNATLLEWPAGHEVAEHVNEERDVLIVVLEGSAVVTLDGDERPVAAGEALLIPKGAVRRIRAGDDGVRYVSVHRRRGPLQIEGAPGGPTG